jgi:hypothetical protein
MVDFGSECVNAFTLEGSVSVPFCCYDHEVKIKFTL